ncbi:MAG: hypothetical protein U0992_13045 [Planctomycetaceae bacterium]
MRKALTILTAVAVAGVFFAVEAQPVRAQKQYMDALSAKYPKVAAEVKTQQCKVCHGAKKTQRNDYAKALEKALGEKKVKDVEKINKALDTVAGQEYADGKEYGDLLNDGKLPAFSE